MFSPRSSIDVQSTTITSPSVQKVGRRSTRTGLPLWLEITMIIIIKLVSIFLLWKLFFSHPSTKKMRLPTAVVEQHLLTPAIARSSTDISKNPVSKLKAETKANANTNTKTKPEVSNESH
jgi:hypothetical protein